MKQMRNSDYDERQLLVRGQAFKKTFIIFVVLTALMALIEKEFKMVQFDAYTFIALPVWLSITFLYIYCIHYDAYDGLNKDGTSGFIALMMGGVGVVVLLITLYKIVFKGIAIVENGIAQDTLAGLVTGLCMLIFGIAYLLKKKQRAQIAEED